MRSSAFTLIELLIVVAIIAILAAIAVPNFLEAQTRSKVSRVKADMRSISTALNAYAVDANKFPPAKPERDPSMYNNLLSLFDKQGNGRCTTYLTTPVAYITSLPEDPFGIYHPVGYIRESYSYTNISGLVNDKSWTGANAAAIRQLLTNANLQLRFNGPGSPAQVSNTVLTCPGPMKWAMSIQNISYQTNCTTMYITGVASPESIAYNYNEYDPTNGTVSAGCIYRIN